MSEIRVHHSLYEEAEWELHTIRDFIRFSVSEMSGHDVFIGHGTEDVFAEATALVMGNLNLEWDADPEILDARILPSEKKKILAMLHRRIDERIPLAYLLNMAYFCGLPFFVDERVLVPRSPIAELIENGFVDYFDEDPEAILDLCTGSACIAVALAHAFPDAWVHAADISEPALEVAALNIEHHEMSSQIDLVQSDLFAQLGAQVYDLIVCNPPYVGAASMADLPQEYTYEPELALAAGRDGLDLVRRILAEAAQHLSDRGVLVLEVGESKWNLEQVYPEISFEWIEFERGGDGVLVMRREQLLQHQAVLTRAWRG